MAVMKKMMIQGHWTPFPGRHPVLGTALDAFFCLSLRTTPGAGQRRWRCEPGPSDRSLCDLLRALLLTQWLCRLLRVRAPDLGDSPFPHLRPSTTAVTAFLKCMGRAELGTRFAWEEWSWKPVLRRVGLGSPALLGKPAVGPWANSVHPARD